MIRSFKSKLTETVSAGKTPKRFPASLVRSAQRKLVMIDSANELNDLKSPPGNKLEALKGNRKWQYSIRINDQWRICFEWIEGHAENVEIVDYH